MGSIGPRNWMLGKDLSALNLYAGSRNSDGSISWSSYASLSGRVDYIGISDQRMLDMIAPVDAIYAHYELTLLDSSLVMGEIQSKVGTANGDTFLAAFAELYQYCKVIAIRGGRTYTYYGTIRDFGDGVKAYGKNAVEMTLAPVDTGVSPLSYQ